MPERIIIDPGHGGFDAGAVYMDRKEKNDNLRLALAVGERLAQAGYDILYTRTMDQYDSPYDKAQIANNAKGDVFISFHRNFAAERPNLYNGVQSLVYGDNPVANRIAEDVNAALEKVGFQNLGIEQRKELVVLRRTNMPAVLLEVGFLNSDEDNKIFDEKFNEVVDAITSGIMKALPLSDDPPATIQNTAKKITETISDNTAKTISDSSSDTSLENTLESAANDTLEKVTAATEAPTEKIPDDAPSNAAGDTFEGTVKAAVHPPYYFYVQTGLFRHPENAIYLLGRLRSQGFPVLWHRVGGLIGIWVGPQSTLDEAVGVQTRLRSMGYDTLIVSDRLIR